MCSDRPTSVRGRLEGVLSIRGCREPLRRTASGRKLSFRFGAGGWGKQPFPTLVGFDLNDGGCLSRSASKTGLTVPTYRRHRTERRALSRWREGYKWLYPVLAAIRGSMSA